MWRKDDTYCNALFANSTASQLYIVFSVITDYNGAGIAGYNIINYYSALSQSTHLLQFDCSNAVLTTTLQMCQKVLQIVEAGNITDTGFLVIVGNSSISILLMMPSE